MKSPSTARVSLSLLVTLCIWVASGDGLSLHAQGASHRRSALGVAQQSTSLYFLFEVASEAESSEDQGHAEASERIPSDLALLLRAQGHRGWTLNGARGYFLPLPRAPSL